MIGAVAMESRKLAVTLAGCLVSLCLSFSVRAEPIPKPVVTESGGFEKILFVGNSFSYFNNGIHNHFSNLVRANGQWQARKNRFRLLTLSGGKFAEQTSILPGFLDSSTDDWDIVVLQAHSTGPIGENSRKDFSRSAKQLVDISRRHGAKPALFMTWAYKDRSDMAASLAKAYIDIANQENILVVPVGLAFADFERQHPDITLHSPDFRKIEDGQAVHKRDIKHPSVAGTYLTACVFYAALYDQSPQGNLYTAGLNPDIAKKIQDTAWLTVQKFYGRNTQ